jgi:hypothetical protein
LEYNFCVLGILAQEFVTVPEVQSVRRVQAIERSAAVEQLKRFELETCWSEARQAER